MQVGFQVGLIGQPVGHSRSPALQQAAFDALGIPARYVLWETAPRELAARVAALRDPGMLGANVTIPYKTAVLSLLDELGATARLSGAVNTIVRVEDEAGGRVRLIGHNTDVAGLRRALDEADAWGGTATDVRRVLLLGAGGAARAVVAAARLEGAAVTVAARRVEAGWEALTLQTGEPWLAPTPIRRGEEGTGNAKDAKQARRTRRGGGEATVPSKGHQALQDAVIALDDEAQLAAAMEQTTLLVNATPVGMSDPNAAPIPLEMLARLPAGTFVFDLVYAPAETALVRAARARGLRASGGLPMLLYQGAAAFALWTGQPAPIEVMRDALMR